RCCVSWLPRRALIWQSLLDRASSSLHASYFVREKLQMRAFAPRMRASSPERTQRGPAGSVRARSRMAGASAPARLQFEFRGIAIHPPATGAERARATGRLAAEASEREAEHRAEAAMQTQEQQTRVSGSAARPPGGITLAAAPRAVQEVLRS